MNGMRTAKIVPGLIRILLPVLVLAAALRVGAQESSVGLSLPVLSVDECVRLALEESPTLLVSEERREIASEDVKGAWGAFLPSLSASRNWSKSERTDIDVPQTADPNGPVADEIINSSYRDISGSARLNVFSGFSKFSSLNSAKSSLRAAEASRDYTRQLVVEDVIAAYYNLLRYLELLDVAVDTRDQAARELERTETYFRLGSAAKSDVLQQRVRLGNTKLDLVVADNTVKKAFADLAFSMNRPLAEEFTVDRSALDTDFVFEDVQDLYRAALDNRLDLRSSEHALAARRSDVTTATSGLYPRLDVNANFNRYENESPFRFGAQESKSTTFGYSVSWDIFDRMQTYSARSKAKANARIAEYELDQARLNVQVEIRQLHNSLVEARERASVSRETIEQSEEDLRLAQERFRVGAGTTLDVIVAQVNLANSRAQEVQAKCDFLIARSQMDRAVGRLGRVARAE